MATFPPTVAPPGAESSAAPSALPIGGGAMAGGAGASPGGGSQIKLAMLSQAIQGLAKEFPQGQQAIDMMMKGLRMLQGISATQAAPGPQAAPPL